MFNPDDIRRFLSGLWRKTPLEPTDDDGKFRILFVCMGNLCRSPIACTLAVKAAEKEGLSDHLLFDSAGTHSGHIGEPADQRARQVALRRGYDLSGHRARQVTEKDFRQFDLILAMDSSNLSALQRSCPPELAHRVRTLMALNNNSPVAEIPDPYYGNLEGFEHVFDLCETAITALIRAHRRGELHTPRRPGASALTAPDKA